MLNKNLSLDMTIFRLINDFLTPEIKIFKIKFSINCDWVVVDYDSDNGEPYTSNNIPNLGTNYFEDLFMIIPENYSYKALKSDICKDDFFNYLNNRIIPENLFLEWIEKGYFSTTKTNSSSGIVVSEETKSYFLIKKEILIKPNYNINEKYSLKKNIIECYIFNKRNKSVYIVKWKEYHQLDRYTKHRKHKFGTNIFETHEDKVFFFDELKLKHPDLKSKQLFNLYGSKRIHLNKFNYFTKLINCNYDGKERTKKISEDFILECYNNNLLNYTDNTILSGSNSKNIELLEIKCIY